MASTEVPEGYADLLERPLFAHLATVRPDGFVAVRAGKVVS